MNFRLIAGIGIPAALGVGGLGYMAARAIGDELGDSSFASTERDAGTAARGYRVTDIVDAAFEAQDTRRPKGMVGGAEYQTARAEWHRPKTTYGTSPDVRQAPYTELLLAADGNDDDVTTREELTRYLDERASGGIISGDEAAKVQAMIGPTTLTSSHGDWMLPSVSPLTPTAPLDASEAAAMLQSGTRVTATIDGERFRIVQDADGRDYDVERYDAIEHAKTGSPWAPVTSAASAADALVELRSRGADEFHY